MPYTVKAEYAEQLRSPKPLGARCAGALRGDHEGHGVVLDDVDSAFAFPRARHALRETRRADAYASTAGHFYPGASTDSARGRTSRRWRPAATLPDRIRGCGSRCCVTLQLRARELLSLLSTEWRQ